MTSQPSYGVMSVQYVDVMTLSCKIAGKSCTVTGIVGISGGYVGAVAFCFAF
jgi:fructose-bisphosphate aldolase class 1